MDQLLSYFLKWKLGRNVNLNDYSDKFHYLILPIFLIVFATLTTVRQYVFQPIMCEVASKPSGINFAEYISNLCWIEGTYSEIDVDSARLDIEDSFWKSQKKALYYQWVPFTLALQAALFYLPRVLWLAYIHNREGPDFESLFESAAEANKTVDWKLRRGLIDGLSRSIDYMLTLKQGATEWSYVTRRRPWRRYFSMRPRGFLPGVYVAVKLLFLANALGQIYLMSCLLAPEYPTPFLFGFHLIRNLVNGFDWQATRFFPRVTLCRVKILHIGGTNTYTGQCVLPLNMLNEKIYCFLWIAAALGASLTCFSLVQWAMRMICGQGRWRHHLRQYLMQSRGHALMSEKELVGEFARHLHSEGVFLVHMLRLNVGEIIACDVTNTLFDLWRERRRAAEAETHFTGATAEGSNQKGKAEAVDVMPSGSPAERRYYL